MSSSSSLEVESSCLDEIDEIADTWNFEDLQKALDRIEELDIDTKNDSIKLGALRRKADYLYALSNLEADKKKRIQFLEEGRKAAEEGNKIDENDFSFCKLLCSTTGRLAEESGITKKVHYGFLFKTALDKALTLDENNFEMLHMRGRFCYQVSSLSTLEKMAAKVVGSLPSVTFDDAVKDLLKAESIEPGSAENQLFIGKTYIALGKDKEAKKWLKKASEVDVDPSEAVELEHVQEAKELLSKM